MKRHDELFGALVALQGALEARDPLAAEVETERVLQLLFLATEPAADLRLRPIFGRCQVLADELKASLQAQLRQSATTSRATLAYEREAP